MERFEDRWLRRGDSGFGFLLLKKKKEENLSQRSCDACFFVVTLSPLIILISKI